MIKGRRRAESAIDPGVVFHRNSGNPARFHEGQQLIAPGVKENMADSAAFLDFDRVGDHHFETENFLVELARLVEVERGKPDVGEPFVGHYRNLLPKRLGQPVAESSGCAKAVAPGWRLLAIVMSNTRAIG